MSRLTRRDFLKISGAAATSLLPGCMTQPSAPAKPIGRVIVIGGGFGGGAGAEKLRLWGGRGGEGGPHRAHPQVDSLPHPQPPPPGNQELGRRPRRPPEAARAR